MLFKQAVIEYSLKHGVITAAIRYKPADKICTAGGRNMMEQFGLWQTAHTPPSQPSQTAYRGRDHTDQEYAPQKSARWSGGVLGQVATDGLHPIYLRPV